MLEIKAFTARGIFNESGDLVYQIRQNGGSKFIIETVAPAKEQNIDDLFRELTASKEDHE